MTRLRWPTSIRPSEKVKSSGVVVTGYPKAAFSSYAAVGRVVGGSHHPDGRGFSN